MVTGDIKVVGGGDNTRVAFKNCLPFTKFFIHLNDENVETAENLDLTMSLYNLIEYSDNYADSTGSSYYHKRPEQPRVNGAINILSVAEGYNISSSFKHQSNLIKDQVRTPVEVGANIDPNVANANRAWKNIKIAVSLKYKSNLFRALELPLINTKLYIELNWTKHSILSDFNTATTFQITKTELYVPVVTLNTENNNKLTNFLNESFERSVIWNEYKSRIQTVTQNDNNFRRILLNSSFSGVNRLLVMCFNTNNIKRNNADPESHRRYFLPRIGIKNYNVLIDGRNFYDQIINDSLTRYNELLK